MDITCFYALTICRVLRKLFEHKADKLRGYNILFCVLTFAKLECDNELRPESSEGCNTLSHKGLANVNTGTNVISPLLYTFRAKMAMKPSAAMYKCD